MRPGRRTETREGGEPVICGLGGLGCQGGKKPGTEMDPPAAATGDGRINVVPEAIRL